MSKVKDRFSTTDVQAMVRDIRSVVMGQRVSNIYDVNDKTYLFKFAGSGDSDRIVLLMESGKRFHTTKFSREKSDSPSPFSMKLRRYLRTKRLEGIKQLGSDRVVDFKFGSASDCNHIILELYANGNIILTDSNYEVLALLRSHQFDEDVAIKAGEIYPMAMATVSIAEGDFDLLKPTTTLHDFQLWANGKCSISDALVADDAAGSQKKSKAKKQTLRQLLLSKDSGVSSLGVELIDHSLCKVGFAPSLKLDKQAVLKINEEEFANLSTSFRESSSILESLNMPGQPGYILLDSSISSADPDGQTAVAHSDSLRDRYEEFVPYLFLQHRGRRFIEFQSFDDAVDEYFCKIEDQKLDAKARQQENLATKKIEAVRNETTNMLQHLTAQQKKMQLSAQLVEAFGDVIDKACLVINSALGAGMTWSAIEDMVQAEKSAGNPIASIVAGLHLEKNTITVQLENLFRVEVVPEESDIGSRKTTSKASEEDGGKLKTKKMKKLETESLDVDSSTVLVEINLELSAFANARQMYSNRKVAQSKEIKTIEASVRAMEAVEEQQRKALNKQNLARSLKSVRKVHWFEKFNWFITTEGYLVLSGRDAQQNEILVKKYLRLGDVYVHADLAGASSCIVRAKVAGTNPDSNGSQISISPLALQEAGVMSVCRSVAWNNKVVISAWWVRANQVSKTAPSGEYLTTGSFMIYGKKNFLPPSSLEMGFGILFRLADSSVGRHLGERKDKASALEELESVYSEAFDRYDIPCDEFFGSEPLSVIVENDHEIHSSSDNEHVDIQTRDIGEAEELSGAVASISITNDRDTSPAFEDAEVLAETAESGSEASDEDLEVEGRHGDTKVAHADNRVEGRGKMKKAPAPRTSNTEQKSKAKKLSKRCARKYADQDDEDRELAMIALGHFKDGRKPKTVQAQNAELLKSQRRQEQQQKLGVKFGKESWSDVLICLSDPVRIALQELIDSQNIREGEIDSFEIKSLGGLGPVDGLTVVQLFRDGFVSKGKIGNKSGFLAGILRRFNREKASGSAAVLKAAPESLDNADSVANSGDERSSRREKRRQEQAEIQAILEEEGVADEEEGKQADELEKLTGTPFSDDQILYAVPVCGPYQSLMSLKYRVKLTPGTLKRGKACKQALEIFTSMKDIPPLEKQLIKGITDPEAAAVMIGDVRLSVPGLQQIKKKIQRGQKKPK